MPLLMGSTDTVYENCGKAFNSGPDRFFYNLLYNLILQFDTSECIFYVKTIVCHILQPLCFVCGWSVEWPTLI